MKLSTFIFQSLKEAGYDTVFLVTGGGAMHLNDSIGRVEGLKIICNHHEQASAMAAEGYSRVTNKPAVVNVTTGPGAINAINGVFGAWTDSIPMIIISGQVKRETLMSSYNIPGLRQLGDQEVDIVRMVSGITKYAHCVTDPNSIKFHLEKAMYLAVNGRPGPVWLDIPVDVQGSQIDENNLKSYIPSKEEVKDNTNLSNDVKLVIEKLKTAERPIMIGGMGIRLANAMDAWDKAARKGGIPVTTAWTQDTIENDHPYYVGQQGTIGDRAGNFAVQNSDLVIIIGSRMCIRQVSYNWENFARHAYKIQVDIDPAEMKKPTMKSDLQLCYDAKDFLEELARQLESENMNADKFKSWVEWCMIRKAKYPVLLPHHQDPTKPINPYFFLHTLHTYLTGNDIIACADGSAIVMTFQVAKIKKGQLMFHNSGSASMGFDLPAAIGAATAAPERRIICIAGDGSIQMNIQELQTIAHHRMNIKIFVLDNGGYLSIKQTQKNFFGLAIGSDAESGVSFPDLKKVAESYKIPAFELVDFDFQDKLQEILKMDGPVLCNVKLDVIQSFEPKLSSKQMPDGKLVTAPLEDMFPFLSEEELAINMIVPVMKH
jgi:acetolactate synthase I/II/III large subunit